MDFGLSEEQGLLQHSLRAFLAEQVPASRVREIADTGLERARGLWQELTGLGIAGVLVPEEHGGSGLSLLDAALLAEELGRAVAPAPFLGSAVLAPIALVEAGSPTQQKEWLPGIATGSIRVGAALAERSGRREGAGVRLEGGRLFGKALMAVDVPEADAVLVATEASTLALVAADAPGLSVEELRTIDHTRRCAELRFEGVEILAPLESAPDTSAAIDRILDAARAVLTGDTVGACQSMLDQALAYAGQRRQFGRSVSSFQAVKHLCAEMAAELEPARSLMWYAAHALRALPEEAPLAVTLAKSHVAEVATQIADLATQVHGGIGYTDEQNLHLWFKRIGLNRQLFGGPEWLRERAAYLQGFGGTPRAAHRPSV